MERKEFLLKGLAGIGGITALSVTTGLRSVPLTDPGCTTSPRETKGPFPNKTPAELLRANITGDREGVPLRIDLEITNSSENCTPIPGAVVDIWHCDRQGHYSEYGNGWMQQEDFTGEHFLRGRQTADSAGRVSFISIFPGYYRGRAPHLHIEILKQDGASLLVTQIAFPPTDCDQVYARDGYQGSGYVSNERDGVFRNSLEQNMADALTGNPEYGYTLKKRISVDLMT